MYKCRYLNNSLMLLFLVDFKIELYKFYDNGNI